MMELGTAPAETAAAASAKTEKLAKRKKKEVRTGDLRMVELIARWGCQKNSIKARAAKLGVDLIRPSNQETYWPVEYLELGDLYDEHAKAGGTYSDFPPLMEKAKRSSRNANDCFDPFGDNHDLMQALQVPQYAWTTKELARICRVSTTQVLKWKTGDMIRLGVVVTQKYRDASRQNAPWYWRIGQGEPQGISEEMQFQAPKSFREVQAATVTPISNGWEAEYQRELRAVN